MMRSEHYGELQAVVNCLYPTFAPGSATEDNPGPQVRRLDVILVAEAFDLPEDLLRIVQLLPPGTFTRQQLTDQLNSAITGHAWGNRYGTVC